MSISESLTVAADVSFAPRALSPGRRVSVGTRVPLANERRSKRHGAAALQNAVATDCASFLPQGFGVRQPYAAFVACVRSHHSIHWPTPFLLGVWNLFHLVAYGPT
jgi:hypothetical protein